MRSSKTQVMRGVNLLRLLVLFGLISLIAGIATMDVDDEEAVSEETPPEPDADAFEEKDAAESNDAPAEADFAPEQTRSKMRMNPIVVHFWC